MNLIVKENKMTLVMGMLFYFRNYISLHMWVSLYLQLLEMEVEESWKNNNEQGTGHPVCGQNNCPYLRCVCMCICTQWCGKDDGDLFFMLSWKFDNISLNVLSCEPSEVSYLNTSSFSDAWESKCYFSKRFIGR